VAEIDDLNRGLTNFDRDYFSYERDLDGKVSRRIVTGKTLKELYLLINNEGFLSGETFDGFLAQESPISGFVVFHYFNQGVEQFSVNLGFNASKNIGALKTQPAAQITDFFFVQDTNLGNEPTGSTMGALFAIGGQNVVFSIIQDLSGYFEISDGNLIKSTAPVPEGTYTLVVKSQGNSSQYVDQITIVVLATALISNINLSEVNVTEGSAIGTVVGAFSTSGGEPPITYTILSQQESGINVDVFEIVDDSLQTKDLVGLTGTTYTLFIQAEDSRSNLPDDERIKVEEFTINVVDAAFTNSFSLLFNGIDEKIEVPTSPTLNPTSEMTLGCWVKTNHNDNQSFMAKWLATNNKRQYFMGMLPTGELRVLLSGDGSSSGGAFKQYSTVDLINDNQWHFVAMTFNTNILKLYIDGTERTVTKTIDETINNLYTSDAKFQISSFDSSTSFYADALIDECAIWNKELSAAEILTVYNSGAPTNLLALTTAPSMQGWWRMGDFFIGGAVPDQTTNNNDGTSFNMNNSNRVTDIPI
jgi:hypothetical protein